MPSKSNRWAIVAKGCAVVLIAGYAAIGVATALVMGFIGGTSNEEDAWWADPGICLAAWPAVWIAVAGFVMKHWEHVR